MYMFLVSIHVVAMVISILLMSGALVCGALSKNIAVKLAGFGTLATMTGFLSGLLLMAGTPLDVKCLALTVYVASVTAIYYYGYGFGDIKNARLIRSTV